MGLTRKQIKQIERQDFVDNAIFEFLHTLLDPSKVDMDDWNIEDIAAVRDAIKGVVVDKWQLMSEEEFYPSFGEGK